MKKKLVIFFHKFLIVSIVFYFEISSGLFASEDKPEDVLGFDYSDSSYLDKRSHSKSNSNSIFSHYSYYQGVQLDFIINPALRLSYLSAVYYNTFLDLGIFIPLSWSTRSSLTFLTGARYSFRVNDVYTLQIGSSLGLKYQHQDNSSQTGLYFIPRFINLFDINTSLIFSVELFTNINLHRSSKKLSTSIKPNLGLGFIYKL